MIDPSLFEWEPKEVPDEVVWEDMQALGIDPDTLPDPKDRAAYRRWLKKHQDDQD